MHAKEITKNIWKPGQLPKVPSCWCLLIIWYSYIRYYERFTRITTVTSQYFFHMCSALCKKKLFTLWSGLLFKIQSFFKKIEKGNFFETIANLPSLDKENHYLLCIYHIFFYKAEYLANPLLNQDSKVPSRCCL